MELNLEPQHADIQYQLVFKKPIVRVTQGENRALFIEKLIDTFSLRASEINIPGQVSSNDVTFQKFYGRCRCKVITGADEASATLTNPGNIEQAKQLLSMFQSLFESEVAVQKLSIRRQLSSDGSVDEYLNEIVPNIPIALKENTTSKGCVFEFKYSQEGLTVKFMLEKSMANENWLFQFVDFFIVDKNLDFESTFRLVFEKYDNINKEFGLIMGDK